MGEQESEVMHPPIEQDELAEQESTWPKKIGVVSLIYAIGGLLCQVGAVLMTVASDWLMSLFKIEVEVPTLVRLTGGAMAVVMFVIGIIMLVGSVRLLQRKLAGISLLKTWVVLRLVMALIGLVIAILIAPAQIEMQRSLAEFKNEQLQEAGKKPEEINDQELQATVMRGAVIGAGIFSIYPLFLGLYLSRKKITEEVQNW